MNADSKPDMSCVPYAGKKLYLALTLPVMILIVLVAVYLWSFSVAVSITFIAFYILANVFQAYCCAYQDCPYIGGFCPAIAGIIPSSIIAKKFFAKRIRKSKTIFDLCATVAFCCLLGLLVFPLFWLAKASVAFAIAYPVLIIIYVIVFLLQICPVCAIRNTCPGGRLERVMRKRKEALHGP